MKKKKVNFDERIAEHKRKISSIPVFKFVLATDKTINCVVERIFTKEIQYFNKIDSADKETEERL